MPETMDQPERLNLSSLDIAAEKQADLIRLFPEVANEHGQIDFDHLRAVLGEVVDAGKERYGMVWPGKSDCARTIQKPSMGTLLPLRESSIDWDNSKNVIVEGDNLEVLKLLQKSYLGGIKLVYIDPPYNTGADFIYPDNYSESLQTYLEYTGQVDSEGRRFGTNVETDGRFHSNWMNMMYPRLYLARQLLAADGVIAISIGETELANLLNVCAEVFGEENRITICSRVMKTGGQKGLHFSPCVDYIVLYARDISSLSGFRQEISQNVADKVYSKVASSGPRKGERYRSMGLYQAMLDRRANQRYYIECPDGELVIPPGHSMPSSAIEGEQVAPNDGDGVWRWTYSRYQKERALDNIEFIKSERTSLITSVGKQATWNVYYKIWLKDRLEDGQLPGNILDKFESRHSSAELKQLNIPFDFAKPSSLIKFLMSVCGVGPNEIVLDFFAGSGSTGHAAMELAAETNSPRPFICVQLPERTALDSEERRAGYETISAITIERIRRVSEKLRTTLLARDQDCGYRVFKLAASNFIPWDGTAANDADQLMKQLQLGVEHTRGDRTPEDLLFEILLKSCGEPALSLKIDQHEIEGVPVFSIADGAFLICLEDQISLELIRALAARKPSRIVMRESSFAGNDQLKANAVQTFKTHGVTSFKVV